MDDPRQIVASGYDAMAERYGRWASATPDDVREEMLATLEDRLPEGARVVDLGCGAGATAKRLSERYAVTGVDISAEQIKVARTAAPRATFVVADITGVTFPAESFDAAVALYSISHVPRDAHAALFARVASWLTDGGWLLAVLGADDAPDWTGDWLGVPMFFSAWDAETNRRLLRAAGFEPVVADIRTTREPDGDVSFLWVLASKTAAAKAAR